MQISTFVIAGILATSTIVAQSPKESEHSHEAFAHHADKRMSPQQFQALPRHAADFSLSYGTDKNQFGELRLPTGLGPHPLAVLIHGGCWSSDFATLNDLGPIGDALKAEGIATWNIEYRRLSQPGSGWPGTYLDVGKAIDFLRTIAADKKLDLNRVIVIGHSAGGHLAMWAAARSRLPSDSELYVRDPLPLRGVISLAGAGDMEAYIQTEERACGDKVAEKMLGGKPSDVPRRYSQVSAIKMLPLGIPQVLVWGQCDAYVPIEFGEKYLKAAKKSGDQVRLVSFPEAGHFEIASPLSATWPTVSHEILSLLGDRR